MGWLGSEVDEEALLQSSTSFYAACPPTPMVVNINNYRADSWDWSDGSSPACSPACLSVWLNDGRHKMNLIVIGCALARTRSSPAPLAGFASSELVPLEGINSNYQPITLLCEIHCHNVACGCYFPSNWTPAASGYPPHVWNPIMHKCRCSGSQLHWFEWNHLRGNN